MMLSRPWYKHYKQKKAILCSLISRVPFPGSPILPNTPLRCLFLLAVGDALLGLRRLVALLALDGGGVL